MPGSLFCVVTRHVRRRSPNHAMKIAPTTSPQNAEPIPKNVSPDAVTKKVAMAVIL